MSCETGWRRRLGVAQVDPDGDEDEVSDGDAALDEVDHEVGKPSGDSGVSPAPMAEPCRGGYRRREAAGEADEEAGHVLSIDDKSD